MSRVPCCGATTFQPAGPTAGCVGRRLTKTPWPGREVFVGDREHVGWTGFPPPSALAIEREANSYVLGVFRWKRSMRHERATWVVGTAPSIRGLPTPFEKMLDAHLLYVVEGWHRGSARRAAEELAQYHGMTMEGVPEDEHRCVFARTDRCPTRQEIRQRDKEPLTLKQKAVFRALEAHIAERGRVPTKTELARAMGHQSLKTTSDYLTILARKSWIHLPVGGRIEMN